MIRGVAIYKVSTVEVAVFISLVLPLIRIGVDRETFVWADVIKE